MTTKAGGSRRSCAPRQDVRRWSTFVYVRRRRHPSRQDGRRLTSGNQGSSTCARGGSRRNTRHTQGQSVLVNRNRTQARSSVILLQAIDCFPGLSLTWSGGVGLKLPLAVGARPLSALVGGGCRLSSPRSMVRVFPVTASWAPEATMLPQVLVPGVAGVLFASLWRRTTFASSELASGRPSTAPPGKVSQSSWPCGCGCQVRGSWHVSGPIHCQRSGA